MAGSKDKIFSPALAIWNSPLVRNPVKKMSSRRRSRRSLASDSDWSHDTPKSKSPSGACCLCLHDKRKYITSLVFKLFLWLRNHISLGILHKQTVSPDSRRRSSRVRKRPDSYAPPTDSPKRKRPTPKKTMKKVSPGAMRTTMPYLFLMQFRG